MRWIYALLAALTLASAPPAAAQIENTGAAPVVAAAVSNTATAALNARTGAGTLAFITCANINTTLAFLQVFDVASSTSVTVGSTVPKASFPMNGGTALGGNFLPANMSFLNGIKIAATTTAKGSTAPSTALDCTLGFR